MRRTKTILLIGASGFVGTHLAMRLRDSHKVFATHLDHPTSVRGVTPLQFDANKREEVKRLVYRVEPDVIIYAAGSNRLDLAEASAKEFERIHSQGAISVSTVSDILQPKFIELSNSYVFDGKKGNYHENDVSLPSTVLGKCKLGAENFLRGKSLNHLIVRSSPLIGRGNPHHLSMVDRLRMALSRGERVQVPGDELHSYALVSQFADLIARLVESSMRNKVVHFGGLTKISQVDFARAFATRFGFNANLIQERASHAPDLVAFDYSVNSTFISEELKIQPLLLEESFDLFEKELVAAA